MKQRLLLLLLPLLMALGARAQITIQQESFANAPGAAGSQVDAANTTSYTTTVTGTVSNSVATKQYFVRTLNGNPPTDATPGTPDATIGFTPTTGVPAGGTFPTTDNFFWSGEAVQGTQGTTTPRAPGIVQLKSVSIAGYTGLSIRMGLFTVRTAGTTWERDDKLEVQVSFDNNGTWNTVGRIVGDNPTDATSAGQWRQDADLDGFSNDDVFAPIVTSPMSDFTFPVTGSGSTIQVRVVVTETGLSEEFAFDNIRLLGTANSSAPPVLGNLEPAALNYAEGAGAVQITSNITVTDADNTTLGSAVVRILNFDDSEDELVFSPQNGISGSYNASTAVLTLTGTATLAAYQAALRSVQYRNNDAIDARDGTRTIQFSVTDAAGAGSSVASRSILVTSSLDAASTPNYTDDLTTNGEGTRYKSNSFVATGATGSAFFRTNVANNEANGQFHQNGVAATTFTNISPSTGSFYWYSAGTGLASNPSTPRVGTFVTKQINAANYANLHFRILLGATVDSWDAGDYSKFYYRLNGGAWTILASFRSTDQTTNSSTTGELAQDANPTNLGSPPTGTSLSAALQQFDFALPASANGQQVDFMIESLTNDTNNNGEVFVFDKIEVTGTLLVAPTVTTAAATSVTTTSAVLGGNVTADGGAAVTERGVVYSTTNTTPTTGDTKAANGSGTGTFSATSSGLTAGTAYYVRAYAINSVGTAYGAVQTFTTLNNAPVVTTTGGTTTFIIGGGAVAIDNGLTVTDADNTTLASATVSITSGLQSGQDVLMFSNTNTTTFGNIGTAASTNGTLPLTSSGATATVAQWQAVLRAVTFNNSGGTAPTTTRTVSFVVNDGTTASAPATKTVTPAPPTTVVSVTRLNPSPTATTQVRYQVVFSRSVSGITISNFNTTNTGSVSGTSVSSASGSGTTYTVTVNTGTGTGNGTLRLNVNNSAGITPTVSGLPYTSGEVYTITRSFAAQPLLSLRGAGSASGNSDVTAFVDGVQIVQNGTSTPVTNALQNGSFETNNLGTADFLYSNSTTAVSAAPWVFTSNAGVARIGGAGFTPPASGFGGFVGLLQTTTGSGAGSGIIAQNVVVPTGTYQVNFLAAQRNYTSADQVLNVFLVEGSNNVFLGTIQPASAATYDAFTSPPFAVSAPALTATVSTTSTNPTSTAPIPFSVTFSQSVGTSFDATDVTVTGGTLTSGSFSGSGLTYTFTVTPSGTGTVSVSVATGRAQDANNTGNAASNTVSVQYAQPVTAAPVITSPVNGSVTNQAVTISGTAPANSEVTVYVSQNGTAYQDLGTYTATAGGTFSTPAFPFPSSAYRTYATAQSPGASVSANSTLVNFTVDQTQPSVAITSTAGASGGSTATTPIPFSVTFSETVNGSFVQGDLSVTGGGIVSGSFSGSGAGPYTFSVTPGGIGSTVSVNVVANVAQDAAGNFNTAAPAAYTLRYAPALTATVSSTSGSPTSTAPIPFSVSFSQSVGTTFVASDVTVSGGTVNAASFSGSGAGPYTFTVTPSAAGTVTVSLAADVANDANNTQNTASNSVSVQYQQPVTAAPVVTAPANGSLTNQDVTISGTAPANSEVVLYISQSGTAFQQFPPVTATAAGTFSFGPIALPNATFRVYATAQSPNASVSPNSNTNTFTVDTSRPSVAISSSAGASGGTTGTSPIPFTVTFSEAVTGFVTGDLTVSNGSISGFTPVSGTTYTFNVTPTTAGTATTVNVPANVAQDAASNFNTAAPAAYVLTLSPTITLAPATLPGGTQNVAYTTSFTASGGSGTYTYAITSGALPSGLSLSSGGALSGTPTVSGTFNFRVTATDNAAAPGPYSGFRDYALTISALTSVAWNGSVSTDWFTASNWTPNTVPDATLDATIPTSPSGNRFPVIGANASQAAARNVSIASGASLSMSANTLTIAGNLTNNGAFNGSTGSGGSATGGTVVLGTTTLANLLGSSRVRFWNLTVNASAAQVSTSAGASVRRLLTLNGNLTTNGNDFVVESDASLTGLVYNNGGVISGSATIQRYIATANLGLGYRHYSAPVGTATVASLATAGFTPVVNPAYNTSATPNLVTPFPTVYGYDQSRLALANNLGDFDKGWFSPASLSDPLTVGKGYTANLAGGQALAVTGPQNNGTYTQSLARGPVRGAPDQSGWQLVGNPYPSPLNYSLVAAADRPNLDAAIYIFASDGQYTGNYRSYVNGVGGDPILAQGQGFFARVSAGQTSGSLTFRNSQRVTSYSNPTYQRGSSTRPLVQLDLQGANGADPVYVYFEPGATAGTDAEFDAVKLPNTSGLNLSATNGPDRLAINGLPVLGTATVTVPLSVGVPAAGSYSFTAAQLLNLNAVPVYLRDRQTGAVVDLARQPSYQFTVSNASALITGRFELVFSPQAVLATAPAALAAQVGVYPNPATTTAFVELPAALGRQVVSAELVDALGRTVRAQSLPAQGAAAHRLSLANLATGLYTLHLNTSAGVIVKKLAVE